MRSIMILMAALFLLAAAPARAEDQIPHPNAQMLARLFGAWLDSVGDTLAGDNNTIAPTTVDGSGNTVFHIDELVINLNMGDVTVEEEYGGAEEVANRLVDLLMQGMEKRGQMRGRAAAGFPPLFGHGMRGPQMEKRPQFDLQTEKGWRGFHGFKDEMRSPEGENPDRPRWHGSAGAPGEHAPSPAGVLEHPRPEIMEMLMRIPAEVEPEFIEFIMEVGRLAREDPGFREHLEQLVAKAHEREAAETGH